MTEDTSKPGLFHSFIGGMILTLVLVLVVPMLTAAYIEPEVNKYLGDVNIDPFTPGMIVTAAMLLVMILFLLLLGGGKIFKKYGVIGVIGLIATYWYLERIYDAILPVAIIIIMVIFSYIKDSKKK